MNPTNKVFQAYRAFHQQAFMPIFVEDGYDSKVLVEACVAAGMKGIEYTLRRRDAHRMIPWIRKNYPELHVFAGSTLDDDGLVRQARIKHPQLLTLDELADMGVSGFISATGWSLESIRRFSPTHVVAPTAMTITEATQQLGAGAHFIKMMGSDLGLVSRCRQANTFNICPILVTGGMTKTTIPSAIRAGAVLVGSGFDVLLAGEGAGFSRERLTEILQSYMQVAEQARNQQWPELAVGKDAPPMGWLGSLPHIHPFPLTSEDRDANVLTTTVTY